MIIKLFKKLGALLMLTLLYGSGIDNSEPTYLIQNINIVDVVNGIVLNEPKDILIKGNRIVIIRNYKKRKKEEIKRKIIDGTGKYIIPGLWDMHVHPDDPEMWRMNPDAASRDLLLPLFVLHGVTGIRDMAGSMEVVKTWKDRIKKKEILGPEIFACGPLIDGPNPMWDGSVGVSNLSQVKPVIDSLIANGSDFLKVYSLLPDSTYFALSNYANQIKVPFVGHVPFTVTTIEASNTGMKSQEHLLNLLIDCSGITDQIYNKTVDYGNLSDGLSKYIYRNDLMIETYNNEKAQKIFKEFVKNKTWHTPTISMWYKNAYYEEEIKKDSVYYNFLPDYMVNYWKPEINDHLRRRHPKITALKKRIVKKYMQVIKEMNQADVKLLAGTDMGANPLCFPGLSLHTELELFVKSGLSSAEALRTATINPTIFLNIADNYGTVEKGKVADLVILNENPLENIVNTRKINAVFRNGEYWNTKRIGLKLKHIKILQKK